ncbi:MAG TPA: hypothetical protein VM925_22835 [Labilithrix sp.]|nr:hypothetical protein [Labilithrix sp.]
MSIAGCVATLLLTATSPAGEPDKPADRAVCADMYKNAQVQRKSGALRRARESLLVCVSDRCPSILQPDCTRWLTEVEAALPSVAIAAKGADGKDITTVRVTVDGQPFTEMLDGKSLSIDPGAHVFVFEHGSEQPIEQTIMVREGEKARVVSVSWAKTQSDVSGTTAAAPAKRGAPTTAWVFGGIGLAGLATFGVLGIHGMSRRSALEDECFGQCSQSKVDSIKSEFMIADIALGVGVVSLGISAALFLTSGGSSEQSAAAARSQAPRVSFGAAPQKNGGSVGLTGTF